MFLELCSQFEGSGSIFDWMSVKRHLMNINPKLNVMQRHKAVKDAFKVLRHFAFLC